MNNSYIIGILTALIRSGISGSEVGLEEVTSDCLKEILKLARESSILYLVTKGMKTNHIHVPENVKNEIMLEIFHFERNEYILKKARKCLNSAQIPFIPLKGSIIRYLYPEKWMRNSCDTDILVYEKDLDKAVYSLVLDGFTTDYKRNYHDVSLYYQGAHLELHFNICENMSQIDKLLQTVWDNAVLFTGYEYRESNTFLVFHTLAHMLYHFKSGRCGFKPFIDIWLLSKTITYNKDELITMLKKCSVLTFYEKVMDAAKSWFENDEKSDVTLAIEEYILSEGVNGQNINAQMMKLAKHRSKFQYLWGLTFIPMSEMQIIYPALKEYKILLPFYYIKRLYTKTIGRENNHAKNRIRIANSQHAENYEIIKYLVNELKIYKI